MVRSGHAHGRVSDRKGWTQRVLSLFMTLVMLFSLLPAVHVTAEAADTAPTQTCNVHKMVRYCKDGKHLATEYCPASSVVEIAALDWNREIIRNIKAQDDEYLLQTLTGKDGELGPVHNKKPSIFPIPGRDDDDDGGSGSWQDWWDKLRP